MQNFTFEIDNIKIPLHACLNFSQSYDTIESISTIRTMNGSAIRQGTYKKLKTTLSGSGSAPVGLSDINTYITHVLKCASPKSIKSNTNIIVIPSARRTDTEYAPVGYAYVDNYPVKTTISISTNTATLGLVDGASEYQVLYVPQLTVYIDVKESEDLRSGSKSWTIEAQEV